MDGINFLIGDQLVKAGIPFVNPKLIANLIKVFLISLADGVHLSIGMSLVNRDKFSPKS